MTKKPFPWKCTQCREKAVRETIVSHEVDIDHDGRTIHVKIAGLKTPKCDNCGLVQPDSEACEAITLAFLAQAHLLTPAQIREYRVKLSLTQKQLATYLGIAEATVSRWENGAQIQQRSLDNLMRLFFGMPQVRAILINEEISKMGFGALSSTIAFIPN